MPPKIHDIFHSQEFRISLHQVQQVQALSGPVLRDTARLYLSDAPLLRAMGFFVSQHGQLGAILPPPLLSVSPLESMRSGGAIPPHKRGISAILARYPMKQGKTRAIPPSAIVSLRDCEATIKIKFSLLRRGWVWGQRGELSKNAVFLGKRHDN